MYANVNLCKLLHFAWVLDEAKCIVVTRVCVSVSVCLSVCLSAAAYLHYCTDPDVTCGSGRGCPLVVHYWADLQSCTGCVAMATQRECEMLATTCSYSHYVWLNYVTVTLLCTGTRCTDKKNGDLRGLTLQTVIDGRRTVSARLVTSFIYSWTQSYAM